MVVHLTVLLFVYSRDVLGTLDLAMSNVTRDGRALMWQGSVHLLALSPRSGSGGWKHLVELILAHFQSWERELAVFLRVQFYTQTSLHVAFFFSNATGYSSMMPAGTSLRRVLCLGWIAHTHGRTSSFSVCPMFLCSYVHSTKEW